MISGNTEKNREYLDHVSIVCFFALVRLRAATRSKFELCPLPSRADIAGIHIESLSHREGWEEAPKKWRDSQITQYQNTCLGNCPCNIPIADAESR